MLHPRCELALTRPYMLMLALAHLLKRRPAARRKLELQERRLPLK